MHPHVEYPQRTERSLRRCDFGGRPVENMLASDKGEYDNEYTINAGSYYEKLYDLFDDRVC